MRYTSLCHIYETFGYDKQTIGKYISIEPYILKLFNKELLENQLNITNVSKLLWNGKYYQHIEYSIENMKKYYLMAIKLNDSNAMNNLGYYYQYIEINYDEMKKYYLMAIDYDNHYAMFNLGNYYFCIEVNYEKMKKYFLMAIEYDDYSAMYNLAHYYQVIEKDYDKMKKYYLMAINLNHSDSMYNLALYYSNVENNYDEMKKYYLMGIECNDSDSMNNLGHYYGNVENNYDEMKKYYLMAIKHNHCYTIKECINKNYYYDNLLKETIINKKYNISMKEIYCPILLANTNKCYEIKKCGHEFSQSVIMLSICPLCRCNI